jgi:hypothetical protein
VVVKGNILAAADEFKPFEAQRLLHVTSPLTCKHAVSCPHIASKIRTISRKKKDFPKQKSPADLCNKNAGFSVKKGLQNIVWLNLGLLTVNTQAIFEM